MLEFLMTGIVSMVCITAVGWGISGAIFTWLNNSHKGMEVFLGTKKRSLEEVTLGKFSIIRTKYELPAGEALVKFIQLANKNTKTKEEKAFFLEMVDTINSIETLGYSVENVVEVA